MKIYIGADHRGFSLKKKVVNSLKKSGHETIDVGTFDKTVRCDYPDVSYKVAKQVASSKNARGILICMTGIGHSIAANKVPGAYAALCYNKRAAALSREHNNSNILVVASKFVTHKEIHEIIDTWLKTPFAGGRHARRVNQIRKMEREIRKT